MENVMPNVAKNNHMYDMPHEWSGLNVYDPSQLQVLYEKGKMYGVGDKVTGEVYYFHGPDKEHTDQKVKRWLDHLGLIELNVRSAANSNSGLKIYLAGSLRNVAMVEHLFVLQWHGYDPFMDWYAAGPQADDYWREYWQEQGVPYKEALGKPNTLNTFNFDKTNIDKSDVMILAMPAGKSGHLELGYAIGKGKVGIYFFPDEPNIERWDVMVAFSDHICVGYEELIDTLANLEG